MEKPPAEAAPEPEPPVESRVAAAREPESDDRVSLRSATFEDLRGLGMTVTQARWRLRYRDERGVDSVTRLDEVPGLPRDFRAELRQKLRD